MLYPHCKLDGSDSNFPVWKKEYSKINIHRSRHISNEELAKVQSLINELSVLNGQKFPANIDHQFYELATKKISSRSKFTQIQIYSERAFWLLLNPFSSWGLPLSLNGVDRSAVGNAIKNVDIMQANQLLSGYRVKVLGKLVGFIYRILIFSTFTFLVVLAVFKPISKHLIGVSSEVKAIVLATTLIMLVRIGFFVFLGGLESRYLVSVVPWIECCCALWCISKARWGMLDVQKNGVSSKP